jgi:DNA polymerase-3 subunit alpha
MADYYYIVVDYKTYKDETKPYMTLRNIKTGEETKTRIKQSKIYKQQPFGEFSILKIEGFTMDFKKKLINGQWTSTDEQEPILEEYEVIKKQ